MNTDKMEFYFEDKQQSFCIVNSAFQPNDGDLVNIRGVTYEVVGRSFTVDRGGEMDAAARCNIIVKKKR